MVMFANDVETNGKQKLPEIKKLISSLDFFCYLIIKEHDEFGVAFMLYFLHSSTIIGSTCVSVWIQEEWIEWVATFLLNSLPKNIILGETNGNTWDVKTL